LTTPTAHPLRYKRRQKNEGVRSRSLQRKQGVLTPRKPKIALLRRGLKPR
jgi:hypothetical protein